MAELYQVRIKDRRLVSSYKSSKKVYHISLDISHITNSFSPGDCIGVYPKNNIESIKSLLDRFKCDPKEIFLLKDNSEISIFDYLLYKADFRRISDSLVLLLRSFGIDFNKTSKIAPVLDLIIQLADKVSLKEICKSLLPILPRYYSIASSQKYNNELHILVSLVEFSKEDIFKYGFASNFLCNDLNVSSDFVDVFFKETKSFHLPPSDDKSPIIMIGAGTGIAPFRAFLQERSEQEREDKDFLIFGTQHNEDFLYEEEWKQYEQLNKLKCILACSRILNNPAYVQDKILEHSEEVFSLINKGAYIYICGSIVMGRAVEQQLVNIISIHAHISELEAKETLNNLKKANKIKKDLY